ncbi:MAG: hypothetical protein K6F40_01755 [Bacteroidales bacterium]|nr:hypothetical protein [Bacteroidales bacterium]
MEKINIYHSFWKKLPLLLVCITFVVLSIFMIREETMIMKIIGWIGGLFFGLGGLFVAFLVLKEKITGKPYLVITDKSLRMNTLKDWEIQFSDVQSFALTGMEGSTMIGIHFKPDVESRKMDEASFIGRKAREKNVDNTGFQEAIPVGGLTMSPQAICDLLNERVHK